MRVMGVLAASFAFGATFFAAMGESRGAGAETLAHEGGSQGTSAGSLADVIAETGTNASLNGDAEEQQAGDCRCVCCEGEAHVEGCDPTRVPTYERFALACFARKGDSCKDERRLCDPPFPR